jgi:hypothetical protein
MISKTLHAATIHDDNQGVGPSLWHPHLIRWVSRQDHVKGFLMKQEYISAHTYKLNLTDLIIKILQIKVSNLIHQSFATKVK